VVAKARGILGEKRVGHAGTLDPDATGVLLLGVGSVTRLLRFLSEAGKRYVGEVVLGTATDTLDAAGRVTATYDMSTVTLADVRAAVAEHLTGDIEQVPPMVSALKVEGRRLHELAREGIEVERAARPVTVHRFEVSPTDDPLVYRIDVSCSSGTYVRTLADDLGRLLGGGAHLRALRRTEVGSFTLAEAHPLDELVLLPPAAAVRDLEAMTVDDVTADGVRHGRLLDVAVASPTAVFDGGGVLLAVYEPHRGRAKPAVVLAEPGPKAG